MHNKKTNFGFSKVLASEKYKLVKDVFSGVAPVYDLMNDLMSLGVHRLWKKEFVNLILESCPNTLLDVGGGTGDIVFRLKKYSKNLKAYVLDINQEMLIKGMERAIDLGYLNQLIWILGNAEELPFKDNFFSTYSTAFCFRNLTNIKKGLSEAYRVLRKGGRFYCLEFSKVDNSIINQLYKAWSFKVIPRIGELVAKNKNAYQYLVESIDKFYDAQTFKNLIEETGFKHVTYRNLSFGIVSIHMGIKL